VRGATRPPHRGCLPRGGLDPDGQTICPGGKQELSPSCRLKPCCLRLTEVKGTLQLRCLTRSLGAEEVQGRIGGDDGSRVSAEQIARILGRKDQAAIVFADASGQGNDEATHGGIVEKQAQLVNHEKPAPIAVLDPRPERFSQQIVDGRNHLGPELAHAECDQRCLQVDIGWTAEDLSQAALDPPAQHPTNTGLPR